MSSISMNHPTCGDCGVEQGQLHILGCDMEYCAHNAQLFSCHTCWPDHRERPRCKRFRYIEYALLCGRCGIQYPDFFMVETRIWNHYIEPAHRSDVICKPCFDAIVALLPPPPARKAKPLPADPNQPSLM